MHHPKKERLYQLFAQIGNSLANPHRLELLDLLAQAPRTVENLAQETQMSIANTSQHLQRLKQSHLVSIVREGQHIRYHLADPAVADLWLQLRAVANKQLAEVERALDAYRNQRHEFEGITMAELKSRLDKDEVILLDVRPEAEYQTTHIAGAISLPWDQVAQRQQELPTGKMIVAYCRGPYCVYADEALAVLAPAGWPVARLEEGVLEWQAAGFPTYNSF